MEKIREYLTPRLYCAAGIYLAALAVIYVIQFWLYAGAVATVFYYVLIYPPLFLLAYFGIGKNRKKRNDRAEARARGFGIGAAIMLAGCAMVTYNLISSGNHQRLASWQIIAIVVALAIVALMEKKLIERDIEEKSRADIAGTGETGEKGKDVDISHYPTRVNYVIIVFSLLLLVTLSFLLITRPTTVNDARRVLDRNGRFDMTFERHDPPEAESLPDGAGPLGAYCFSEVGGRSVWVDVKSGRILG